MASEPGLAWTAEHVAALVPTPQRFAAGDEASERRRWSDTGSSGDVAWGTYRAGHAEPYATAVDLAGVRGGEAELRARCTCPSRQHPCKHAVALLLLWVRGTVPEVGEHGVPEPVSTWASRGRPSSTSGDAAVTAGAEAVPPGDLGQRGSSAAVGGEPDAAEPSPPEPPPPPPETSGRDDRVAKMHGGLIELERWLRDRVRAGLGDPALARYSTWDHLAARLVDARAGALANRVRRTAGVVGASPEWHGELLGEMALLYMLARGGRRLGRLPEPLADSLAMALGWQVRQADVLGGVPESDVWDVIGRSDVREDRIEVRRTWLRGRASDRLAMVLSFAAYRQSLDVSLRVGDSVDADVHRYPGGSLRVLVGTRRAVGHEPVRDPGHFVDLTTACEQVGELLAAEPWAEHAAVSVRAALTRRGAEWVLADDAGSLPCDASPRALGAVLAATGGARARLTVEWSPSGLVPLTVHLDDRVLDVGPRADPSFVNAA